MRKCFDLDWRGRIDLNAQVINQSSPSKFICTANAAGYMNLVLEFIIYFSTIVKVVFGFNKTGTTTILSTAGETGVWSCAI